MIKNLRLKKLQRRLSSGLNFSKIYFSKPASVVLITTYAVILVLLLAVLGFSKPINPASHDDSIPSLPEPESFAFLPADNLEVPALGDTEPKEQPKESTPEKSPETTSKDTETKKTTTSRTSTPVVVEKEVVKTVEVPKEVVKTVEKEVVKEVVKKVPVKEEQKTPEPEQTFYDNYSAPDGIPYTPEKVYENFPDVTEEPKETETPSEENDDSEPEEPETPAE